MSKKIVNSVFIPRPRNLDSALHCLDVSLTKQSEKDSTDLNKILATYFPQGVLPDVAFNNSSEVRDYTGVFDFRSMLDTVRSANRSFSELSPKLRKRFLTPENLLEFCSDEANRDEAMKLGLLDSLKQENLPLGSALPASGSPKSDADPSASI